MISKEQLKQILYEQKEYILKKEIGTIRHALEEIKERIELPHVIVLTGIRRCGKSVLLKQIINRFYNNEDFYYVNFEDERLSNFKAEEFNYIYETLIELFGKKNTFFIDEIQNVIGFESFVRRLYETGNKFYITGSSSKLLSRELGTKLTGRHIDITVKPFSFTEFLAFKNIDVTKDYAYQTEVKATIKRFFNDYLLNGGMPEYLTYDDKDLLRKTYEDIVIKDIVVRYNVDNVKELKELYKVLISNFTSKFSFNSLTKITEIGSVNTVKKFIEYIEETYLLKTITKFDHSIKKQVANNKKSYLIDNGFLGVLTVKMTKDYGKMLENLVFNELDSQGEIYYYSDKSECDFIAIDRQVITAMQVCFELNEQNKKREIEGLIRAMDAFKLKEGLILTNEEEEEFIYKEAKIKVMPVWKWIIQRKKLKIN